MTKHIVKSWAHFFDAIREGKKLHDLRKLDRDYKIGDILHLRRYDNINGEYTGEELDVKITYITSNKTPCAFSSSALDNDYGIFSIKVLPSSTEVSAGVSTKRTHEIVKKPIKDGHLFGTGGVVRPGNYLIGEHPSSADYVSPKVSVSYSNDPRELPWEAVGEYPG